MTRLLLADTRQPGFVNDQLGTLGYHVIVRQLHTGDYIWAVPGGRAGMELKQIQDLLTSRANGRLNEQLFRLSRLFSLPLLLVVGAIDHDLDLPTRGGWTYNSMDNMLVGRQRRGIIVARCSGYDDVSDRIHSLVRYTTRPMRDRPRVRRYAIPGAISGRAEVVYSLLASVKGIRDKTAVAERLAANHALSSLFQWGANQWKEVGFTKLMATRLDARLREKGD